MKVEKKVIEKYLDKWQKILRLQDWDIKVKIVETEWRKTGDIKMGLDVKRAILMINGNNPRKLNLEEVVIHELLHLKLYGMDQMIETLLVETFGRDDSDPKFNFAYEQFMILLESTVGDLAKSFLSLNGDNKEMPYEKIEDLVKEEIGVKGK